MYLTVNWTNSDVYVVSWCSRVLIRAVGQGSYIFEQVQVQSLKKRDWNQLK